MPVLLEDHLHMPLHVEGEVIGAAEGALAELALEGLVAGVLPHVPAQLVRPGEPPATVLQGIGCGYNMLFNDPCLTRGRFFRPMNLAQTPIFLYVCMYLYESSYLSIHLFISYIYLLINSSLYVYQTYINPYEICLPHYFLTFQVQKNGFSPVWVLRCACDNHYDYYYSYYYY